MALNGMSNEEFIKSVAKRILGIKAVSPMSGGTGEGEKASEIKKILEEIGYSGIKEYNVYDDKNILRPNLVLKIGNFDNTLWIISHMDTVPEGDINLWKHEPYKATIEEDKIFGRGSEDNGQSIFTSLLLLKNLKKEKLQINIGIAFVSDEETGNDYGIKHLLKQNIFNHGDLIIVPDAGTPDGLLIETAEKTVLQLKFTVSGKQGHASMPESSINALRESSRFIDMLDIALHSKYDRNNSLFYPPYSTFEPTKHEKNIDNINTIPGTDIFYIDCRILPDYKADEILSFIDDTIKKFIYSTHVNIKYEVIERVDAPAPTAENARVIKVLKEAILAIKHHEAKTIGIGGETFASFFRKSGYDAAVWSTTIIESAHMPDEYSLISDAVGDSSVYEYILYNYKIL
ncbi:MAG: M20 family metallo-hydrolase [Ferroplasma sp.]